MRSDPSPSVAMKELLCTSNVLNAVLHVVSHSFILARSEDDEDEVEEEEEAEEENEEDGDADTDTSTRDANSGEEGDDLNMSLSAMEDAIENSRTRFQRRKRRPRICRTCIRLRLRRSERTACKCCTFFITKRRQAWNEG